MYFFNILYVFVRNFHAFFIPSIISINRSKQIKNIEHYSAYVQTTFVVDIN